MHPQLPSLALLLSIFFHVSAGQDIRTLEPGKAVERDIAGGESHTYQVSIPAGQVVQFRLDQRALDSSLILTTPDGKQIAEVNLTDAGNSESLLSPEGSFRLTVRGIGGAAMSGSYRLEVSATSTATAQDQKHLIAQARLLEAQELTAGFSQAAPQAIEKLEQALSVWRELGTSYWIALTLNKIGRAYIRLNQNEKAIASCEQALTIYRESKQRLGEAAVLNNLANAYFNLRQFEKAAARFEQLLTIYREVKDRRWEGLVLFSMGNTANRLNQPDKAIEYYELALAILREVKDRSYEAQVLLRLGNVCFNRGQSQKAIESTELAAAIFREVKDRPQEGQALNDLGYFYNRVGQSEKAIETIAKALAIIREIKDRRQEGNTLHTLGAVYGSMGQTEKAIEYFEQALAIGRETGDKRRQGNALATLGLAHSFLSQYQKAIELLNQALPILQEIKDRSFEASVFSYMGNAYTGLGRYEKSIESREQALAIFRELKDRLFEGNELQGLGNTYKLMGRVEKSVEYYEQALPIFRETKYRVGEGNALFNLAESYARLNRNEESIRTFDQALAIYRELKYRPGESVALMEIGAGHARLGRHQNAMELYNQALAIFREVKRPVDEARVLLRMGESKQKIGQPTEAAALLTDSVNLNRQIGNRGQEITSLTALARLEGERGNLAQARTHIEDSLRIAETLRSDLVSRESRTSIIAAVQDSYQIYTDLLMRQHRADPTKGFDALAVETSERQRARSLLDLLTEARIDVREGVDAALVERERSLRGQLNDKAQRLTQASKPEQAEALRKEISQLETELERAQAAVRKASPRYTALTQPQPLKFKEIQQQLDADTLLLEYALGEERSYLWAITKDSLKSYELPKGEVIEKEARLVHELLSARSTTKRDESALQRQQRFSQAEAQLPAAAAALSQTLLAPVAGELDNKRLVIVADGPLQYVPFAMLPDPKSASLVNPQSPVPLIVGHEVVSLSSASALAVQRAELAGRQAAPKLLAVIADPVFDRSDERLKSPATEASNNQLAQSIDFNDARSIEHLAEKSDDSGAARRLIIPRLPFTRHEATLLLALAPKGSSFAAMDFQANRETVLKGDLGQYRYVHFATHGLLDAERPGLSALVLSMVDEQGKQRDGFLRTNDIYNLKLPVELVVLSACQTGLGKEIKGEGLVGLTRGFMYAGAARVVVSLWSVNDRATAELMTKFYNRMVKLGERPAAALRAAQVEMWKQKKWQSPYYWAAFTLQGEWR
jgi:CHAT domain-containing protein/tetratricopeptide (TPR) repeat protein